MAQAAGIAGSLAMGAALFITIGDVVHQRPAYEVTDEPVGNIGLLVKLLYDRRWLAGQPGDRGPIRAASRSAGYLIGVAGRGPVVVVLLAVVSALATASWRLPRGSAAVTAMSGAVRYSLIVGEQSV